MKRIILFSLIAVMLSACVKAPTHRPAYTAGELDMISECRAWVKETEDNKRYFDSSIPADQRAFVAMHRETMAMIKETFGKNSDICQPGGDDGYYQAYAVYAQEQSKVATTAINRVADVATAAVIVGGVADVAESIGSRSNNTTTTTVTEVVAAE